MRSRDADAVSRLLPRLTPLAVLLADDTDGAVRLLITALSAPRARRGPDDAVRALVRTTVHRPRWAAEQVIETRTSVPNRTAEDTALTGAWRALDVRDRAALALDLLDGASRSGPGVRAARGRLEGLLAPRDEAERRERVQAAALYLRPGSTPTDPAAPDLPERLARLAADRPLPEHANQTIGAAISAVLRARRSRRLWLAAAAVAVGTLVAVVPFLPQGPATPVETSVYGGPTRGSLAGNEDFLRTVRESGWDRASQTPGPRHVVFAGDVPGGRWALIAAGEDPARPATTAWFTGPAGARPDQLGLLSIRVAPDPAEPVSLTDPATGALVVVGAPGDRIGVSERPEVGVGGSIARTFRTVTASRGTAVVGLAPVPDTTVSAVRLRVTRDHRRLDAPSPTVVAVPGRPPVDVTPGRLRAAPPEAPGNAAVAPRLRAVLGQLGEPVGDTPVIALWSGDLPGPNDHPARLTVVAVPQPSGAVVVTTPYGYAADPTGRAGSSWCGTGVLPAGVPLPQRVVAVVCDLSDLAADREISRFLVVVAPPGAASMRLLDRTGAVLRERPLADGVAVVRSPGEVAEVEVATADGGTTSAIPLVDADLAG